MINVKSLFDHFYSEYFFVDGPNLVTISNTLNIIKAAVILKQYKMWKCSDPKKKIFDRPLFNYSLGLFRVMLMITWPRVRRPTRRDLFLMNDWTSKMRNTVTKTSTTRSFLLNGEFWSWRLRIDSLGKLGRFKSNFNFSN